MIIDITIEDERWRDLALDAIVKAAADAVAAACLDAQTGALAEVSVLACDDTSIAELNAQFRDKTTPTNVLSWPETDLAAKMDGATPDAPDADFDGTVPLGDIAISYDTCLREADAAHKPVKDHVTHLVIHGILHLLGYDHIRDQDATLMEGIEVQILGKMGIDDPYMTGPAQ